MASNEECECVKNILDVLVTASDLSKVSKSGLGKNPEIINTAADMLKEQVQKLEDHCAIPTKNPDIDFFIADRYKWAKEDLEKVLKSEGKDKISAINAGDRFYGFIVDNGARMIRCPAQHITYKRYK